MSRMTIEDLDREIAEAEQRRANAVEAGWPKGVRQMDKRLKKLNKKREIWSRRAIHPPWLFLGDG